MRKFILLISTFLSIGCSIVAIKKQQRIKLIHTAIQSIENDDLNELKRVIDTNYFYNVYGEEGFENTVHRTRLKLLECEVPTADSFIISEPSPVLTRYTLQLCGPYSDSVFTRVELVFSFLNRQERELISTIQLTDYSQGHRRNLPPPAAMKP
jgi:hypothetical protein